MRDATGVERNIQLDADLRAFHRLAYTAERGDIGPAIRVITHQIHGGQVAGFLFGDFLPGDFHAGAKNRQRLIVLLGCRDPIVDVVGPGKGQGELLLQRRQPLGQLVDELLQRLAFDLPIVLVDDFLRHRLVIAGLCFIGVRDGRRADLEISLGLGQLFADGGLLRLRHGDVVFRQQHIEVGLRHAQNQILLRGRELRLALQHLLLGLIVGRPVLRPVQRLAERQRVAIGVAGPGFQPGAFERGMVDVGAKVDLRQQRGTALWHTFLPGLIGGAGGRNGRILRFCVLVDLHQVGREHRLCQCQRDEDGNSFHVFSRC